MKLLKIIFSIIALSIFATSCEESDVDEGTTKEPIIEEPAKEEESFHITATLPSSDHDNSINTEWSDSDKIFVVEVGEETRFASYTIYDIDAESISEDAQCAAFTGDELMAGREYIAYVANSGNIYSNSSYQCEDLFQCMSVYSPFRADSIDLIMQSDRFTYNAESDSEITFEHKCAMLELEIALKVGSTFQGQIESITLSSSDNIFLNRSLFDSSGQRVHAFYKDRQYGATDKIEVKLSENLPLSASSPITIKLPIVYNSAIEQVSGEIEFTVTTTDGTQSRVQQPAQRFEDGVRYKMALNIDAPYNVEAANRAALIDLYNSTGGESWTKSQNWCTDAPLSEWYGVTTLGSKDVVTALKLTYNNLAGSIPASIGKLLEITELDLYGNELSGSIPESIGKLTRLEKLRICGEGLTGSIPATIGNLTALTSLEISGDGYIKGIKGKGQLSGEIPDIFRGMTKLESLTLNRCQLSGEIPSSIGELRGLKTLKLDYNQLEGSIDFLVNLINLTTITLEYNNLSGAISGQLGSHPLWNRVVWKILSQHEGYGFNSYPDIYLEPSTITTIDNNSINTEEFFKANKLTCVLYWSTEVGESTYYLETLKELYGHYAQSGFDMITLNSDSDIDAITAYVDEYEIPGETCQLTGYYSNYSEGTNSIKYMPLSPTPTYLFVDGSGRVLFSEPMRLHDTPNVTRESATRAFMANYFGDVEVEDYESIDYSRDGEVITLQQSSVGQGINIVVVGDGFIDKDMESGGEYERRMREAMESIFSEEPFTTHRDRFNVYAVKAVSKGDGVNGVNQTAFGCKFGEGTAITGDDKRVFDYAKRVPSITNTDNLTVITVLNSSKYAGMCYMYSGNDASIAYCPIVSHNDEQFRQIITHEAGGHGFAKLLDEYAYAGTITSSATNTFLKYKSYGWGANVDITRDASEIQWSHLLADSRYQGQVGVYEGALTYLYGVYRSTEKSIMRYNIGGYNAPSREAIYRRIMELSGEEYSYEEFAEYDERNRNAHPSKAAAQRACPHQDSVPFMPLPHPVIIEGTPE